MIPDSGESKLFPLFLASTVCFLAAAANPPGQTQTVAASAPSQPSSGLVNDWLREQSPAFTNLDLGGQVRARFEHKEHFAIPGQSGTADFRASGVDTDNTYLLVRERIHLGYSPSPWLAAFVEARDSSSQKDDRNPNPESDRFDLNQA